MFGRLGLAAASLTVGLSILFADVVLTGGAAPSPRDPLTGFGLLTSDGREIVRPDSGLRFLHTPGTVYENEPLQRVGPYRVNSLGLRGPEIGSGAARPRIIVAGGSAAFGLDVNEQDTLAAALAARLPSAEVLNAGVVGYVSKQELALFVARLLELKPDVLVAFDGWNDLYDRYWWEILGAPNGAYRDVNVVFNQLEQRLVDYERIQSSPARAVLAAADTIARGSTLLTAAASRLRRGPPEPREPGCCWVESVEAAYVSNMLKVRDVAQSRGCRLIVVVQPELGQTLDHIELRRRASDHPDFDAQDRYWVRFPDRYLEFRRRVVPALAAAGVMVVDGSDVLRDETPSQGPIFLDPVHLSREGYAVIAGSVAAHISTLSAHRAGESLSSAALHR
ncbi:MAG: hypothetical protein K1Y01_09825 [Vicinamibacteria bacterium]|nr:hypothetical protein [Vicinamibacteria bacterium]